MKFVSSSEDEGVSFTPKKKMRKKRVLVRASNDSESNESDRLILPVFFVCVTLSESKLTT